MQKMNSLQLKKITMSNVFLIFTIFLLSGCLSSKVADICPFNQDGNCPACKIVEKPKPKPPTCYCVETKIDCEECKHLN